MKKYGMQSLLTLSVIRSIDISAAIVGGALLLPVMLVLSVMVRRDSPGPALLRQTRVGRGEKTFTCYKFRTMAQGTPVVGTHDAPPSAVTRLGARLRRLKLDELPQLWNVAIGEMSLVGPRPSLPSQLELIAERRARNIYSARPGITGPAQVKGIDMSTPKRLAVEDETWIRAPSIGKYFCYIFQTVMGGGQGDRVRG
ncbi:sugar transferase [Kaistia sp. UC242_56]|uniref:sugar transferase n=1 Tax=Kaistia sp. UC242_56 TaxID=3374625 RepID=UPI0037B9D3E7